MKKFKENAISVTLVSLGVLLALMCYKELSLAKQETVVKPDPSEYQLIVTDDSISVYDGKRFVGTVKSAGPIDSLLIKDNL